MNNTESKNLVKVDSCVQTVNNGLSSKIIDSYDQFLNSFGIAKEDFYLFGLDHTIFADPAVAREQWESLKSDLFSNKKLFKRGYGGQGKNTSLCLDLYKYIFNNENTSKDPTNNVEPRKHIQRFTGCRINDNIRNYQCSHIFE